MWQVLDETIDYLFGVVALQEGAFRFRTGVDEMKMTPGINTHTHDDVCTYEEQWSKEQIRHSNKFHPHILRPMREPNSVPSRRRNHITCSSPSSDSGGGETCGCGSLGINRHCTQNTRKRRMESASLRNRLCSASGPTFLSRTFLAHLD